ncbi:unnamed protein product [Prorocentrum cordatum]|uniref:Ste24 endopeptidase n=1 Tax=Prorocentrum cordatum TaxID=2364126 RepID=A0ABN9VK50_9DINO|nr:unnamed protein product [Polarella glacialis]
MIRALSQWRSSRRGEDLARQGPNGDGDGILDASGRTVMPRRPRQSYAALLVLAAFVLLVAVASSLAPVPLDPGCAVRPETPRRPGQRARGAASSPRLARGGGPGRRRRPPPRRQQGSLPRDGRLLPRSRRAVPQWLVRLALGLAAVPLRSSAAGCALEGSTPGARAARRAPGPLAQGAARLGRTAGLRGGGPQASRVPRGGASALAAGSGAGVSLAARAEGLPNAGLSDEELDVVLAREMGHVRDRDAGAGKQTAVTIALFFLLLSVSVQFLDLTVANSTRSYRGTDDVGHSGAGAVTLGLALVLSGHMMFGLGTLLQKRVSSPHEFDADDVPDAITGSDALSYALAKSQARALGGAEHQLAKWKPQLDHQPV